MNNVNPVYSISITWNNIMSNRKLQHLSNQTVYYLSKIDVLWTYQNQIFVDNYTLLSKALQIQTSCTLLTTHY